MKPLRKISRLFFFISLICLFVACHKEVEHIDTGSLLRCHNDRDLDSSALAQKLVGRWKFNRMECNSHNNALPADRDSRVDFRSDGTLVFTDNGIVTNGTWKLVVVQGHKYGFQMNPDLGHFRGRILMCNNNVVVFNNSMTGGCNMEYRRE